MQRQSAAEELESAAAAASAPPRKAPPVQPDAAAWDDGDQVRGACARACTNRAGRTHISVKPSKPRQYVLPRQVCCICFEELVLAEDGFTPMELLEVGLRLSVSLLWTIMKHNGPVCLTLWPSHRWNASRLLHLIAASGCRMHCLYG